MKIKKSEIKRILLITLTNIGDIILTTPIIAVLEREFPNARLDVMVGPLGKGIFVDHPRVFKVIVYNKHLPLQEKRRLVQKLRKIKYDLAIDLKNTLFPILIGARYRTSPIQNTPKELVHKKEYHLWKLKQLGIGVAADEPFSIHVNKKDQEYIDALLYKINNREKLVAVSPSSKSLIKRWDRSGFAEVCERLIEECKAAVVMIGDNSDTDVIEEIMKDMKNKPYNFAGTTSITQLAHLLKRSKLLITNDSAPMHVGCAVGTNVLAIFGPTDPYKYGPRGKKDRIITKKVHCSPCETAQCRFKHECMKSISADEVYRAAKDMLS